MLNNFSKYWAWLAKIILTRERGKIMKLGTKLVNLETKDNYGATNTPVYMTNSFAHETAEDLEKIFNQSRNALELAKFLAGHPAVESVNYPGLKGNKYRGRAQELLDGRFGGILTLRVETKDRAFKIINNLDYFYNLANVGDVKSLVIHPASTIYVDNTKEEKQSLGAYDNLIRVSVGIEDIQDLKQDFAQALSSKNSQ